MVMFDVTGTPVPQGSLRGFVVNGRAVVTHENKPTLRSWRDSVASAAAEASREQSERFPRPMAVRVHAEFRLARPKHLVDINGVFIPVTELTKIKNGTSCSTRCPPRTCSMTTRRWPTCGSRSSTRRTPRPWAFGCTSRERRDVG